MSKIEKYTKFAEDIANDNSHGYAQDHRNGDPDFDCSSLVCTVVEKAGIKVKEAGASYTGNMRKAFLKCGFVDVTKDISLSSGKGLKRGDILLREGHHVAIYCGSSKMVDARINENGKSTGGKPGDQTGHEIEIHGYKNQGWTHVLRYAEAEKTADTYITTANLNLRQGAGMNKQVILTMPKGTKVTSLGKTVNANGLKWLKVTVKINKKDYSGYCCRSYLK